LRCARCCDCPR